MKYALEILKENSKEITDFFIATDIVSIKQLNKRINQNQKDRNKIQEYIEKWIMYNELFQNHEPKKGFQNKIERTLRKVE